MDDFGAGFNSLVYLHALPVHVVKLDRSLAVGAEPDRGLALYRSVIGLCGALGLDVIAEGIEYPAQADTVFTAGCRLAQGHLFGRAIPMSELRRAVVVVPRRGRVRRRLRPAVTNRQATACAHSRAG